MTQVRKTGTAWEVKLDDYAYTHGLDRPGWAWEFLRRNKRFAMDCRISQAGAPTPINHVSGATYLRSRRRFPRAESWGLLLFPDPIKTVLEAPVFWLPEVLGYHVRATSHPIRSDADEALALEDFKCRRDVLAINGVEHVIVRHAQETAHLSLEGLSFLHGKRRCVFHIETLSKVSTVSETLQTLNKLRERAKLKDTNGCQPDLKWRDYLVALDGHLTGRSYRDIAEVLHGAERVKEVWTNETRHLKDRVRRAVERGVELMKGDYRTLL